MDNTLERVGWLYEAEYSSGSYSSNYFQWKFTTNKATTEGARRVREVFANKEEE